MAGTGPMARAVAAALRRKSGEGEPDGRDEAARALARQYARLLDEARGREDEQAVYSDLGPKLLATLAALGLTPAARGGVKGGEPGGGGSSVLAGLRNEVEEQRRKREQRSRAG